MPKYYFSLITPIFECFIQVERINDQIIHRKLHYKIVKLGAPSYKVVSRHYWYSNQRLLLEEGTACSVCFSLTNSIRQGLGVSSQLSSFI